MVDLELSNIVVNIIFAGRPSKSHHGYNDCGGKNIQLKTIVLNIFVGVVLFFLIGFFVRLICWIEDITLPYTSEM